MLTYKVAQKEIKKIPINQDTVEIVESLLQSGKYSVPKGLENTMYEFFDKYKVFYTLIRS